MISGLTIGEFIVDFVSEEKDKGLDGSVKFHKAAGGAPANVAAGMAKLGVNSGFIGKVGEDEFGKFLIDSLKKTGADISQVTVDKTYRTTLAFVASRKDGNKEIQFYRHPGADMMLHKDDLNVEIIRNADLLHFGSFSLASNPIREATMFAVETAREAGAIISYDPNVRLNIWEDEIQAKLWIQKALSFADIVKIAYEEWKFVTETDDLEKGSQYLLDIGVKLVIVTFGKEGSFYCNKNGSMRLPSFKVECKDTLGAGDSFISAILSRLILEDHLENLETITMGKMEEILEFASAAAAITTTKLGVIHALPEIDEIKEFLENNKLG